MIMLLRGRRWLRHGAVLDGRCRALQAVALECKLDWDGAGDAVAGEAIAALVAGNRAATGAALRSGLPPGTASILVRSAVLRYHRAAGPEASAIEETLR